ncbi:MAG: hypothetical protein RSA79_03075 [Oscillospiraceae bacterium]
MRKKATLKKFGKLTRAEHLEIREKFEENLKKMKENLDKKNSESIAESFTDDEIDK